jgi:hypothetical protein
MQSALAHVASGRMHAAWKEVGVAQSGVTSWSGRAGPDPNPVFGSGLG